MSYAIVLPVAMVDRGEPLKRDVKVSMRLHGPVTLEGFSSSKRTCETHKSQYCERQLMAEVCP